MMRALINTLEEKWTEYLIETIVIILGILGAFALNNWHQSTLDRQEEVSYLIKLHSDLNQDLILLDSFINYRESKVVSAQKLLDFKNNHITEDQVQFFNEMINVFLWMEFSPNSSTLDELVSTGNMSLITNESIKKLLPTIIQINEVIVSARDHMRREFDHYLYDRVAIYLDLSDYSQNDPKQLWRPDLKKIDSKNTKLIRSSIQFLEDTQVRNGFFLAAANNTYIIELYQQLIDAVNELIGVLDQELLNSQ